ncbi:unnamed protein product [Rotaria magnacalcarata]|uniref:MULE transposase domain-containing protein n=1 Tax=Rotaria magnacalcarata TaxID=392030 RepID=A0A820S617_9BILA|nr:unnamed protein product [Rotaria magnacalcarata]
MLPTIFFFVGLPVAFCLLPNKRGKTYFELFERLKEQARSMGKQFKPKRIITDFEPGLMPVVEQEGIVVPDSTIIIQPPQIIQKLAFQPICNDDPLLSNTFVFYQYRNLKESS